MINIVELDERINKCLSVLQENPRSRIFAALAEAYRRRGDLGRAFAVCKNGLRIHPDYGAAYVVIARLYLHQNMIEQAREAIQRAISLDSASRATDLVLAEIEIEVGEYKGARDTLDRLDHLGGRDPAVLNLRAQLRDRTRQTGRASAPLAAPARLSQEVKAFGPQSAEEPVLPAGEAYCDSPAAAVEHILRVPRTMICAIWDNQAALLAARATQAGEIGPLLEEIASLFAQTEQQVLGQGWGRLSALRIEEAQGQWGLVREGEMTVLLVGTPHMSYAAAVRKATDCLQQLAGIPEAKPELNLAEHSPE